MMMNLNQLKSVWATRRGIILWQFLFILLSTTWLWAPYLNHALSYRTALISQYEASTQPYSWLFRLGDIFGAALLIWVAMASLKRPQFRLPVYLLLTIGLGMLVDTLLPTTCHLRSTACQEYFSASFFVHALETTITASAIFAIAVYDSRLRKRLVSIGFAVFQVLYGILFLSQLANQQHFNTLSQFVYQTISVIWVAWYYRDFIAGDNVPKPHPNKLKFIKLAIATWAFLNGLLAIMINLADLDLISNKFKGIYFVGENAWLAQHGVVIGVVMIYLSRHLARGELRARQIFLLITGLETLKYSVISPNPALMSVYLLTFAALFALKHDFDRGIEVITLKVRLKDTLFMVGSLIIAGLIGVALLLRSERLTRITTQATDNFFDYTLRSKILSRPQLKSALLAHTITAFVLAGIAAILWILFRPYKKPKSAVRDYDKIKELLNKFSNSSEDYFKLWPADKDYFFSPSCNGFIAYKVVGPIAFALADPICAPNARAKLLEDFVEWARGRRLRACFLLVCQKNLTMYEEAGLNSLQIGASAVVKIDAFFKDVAGDKWWRWQKNRAAKSGYEYLVNQPPHAADFMAELKSVSDAWLSKQGREERGFALGYFDEAYLQKCPIHYLKNSQGEAVAFTNQLPLCKPLDTASVDLLRHLPDANNAMPYLLCKTIETAQQEGYKYFDLGFVPFAAATSPILAITRALSASRFSAKGLEQFKNKFKPDWRPNYLAYDGDLADLALIAVNLERAMKL